MAASKPDNDSLQLQPRDLAFLRGLFESRVMTGAHAAALHFGGKGEYAKRRLRQLKTAGLIAERRRRVNEPGILFLTRAGFTRLKAAGVLDGLPILSVNSFADRADVKELTLRHELEIMDVKAALHGALATSAKFKILEFSTWPRLHQFEATVGVTGHNMLVKPDGFIRIHEHEAGSKGFAFDCFLELDRSTELLDTLIQKAVCYHAFYHSGDYAIRNGGKRSAPEEFPFRVLIVTNSTERRNNTAERLTQNNPPIHTMVWLTTLAEVMADPLGAIWIRPADYRDAVAGTPFHRETPHRSTIYRRQAERDTHVEATIKKRRLLEG